jgi:hypothetical protein
MHRIELNSPAAQLLSHIRAAGYASIGHFIATLRADPMADTVQIPPLGDCRPARQARHRA